MTSQQEPKTFSQTQSYSPNSKNSNSSGLFHFPTHPLSGSVSELYTHSSLHHLSLASELEKLESNISNISKDIQSKYLTNPNSNLNYNNVHNSENNSNKHSKNNVNKKKNKFLDPSHEQSSNKIRFEDKEITNSSKETIEEFANRNFIKWNNYFQRALEIIKNDILKFIQEIKNFESRNSQGARFINNTSPVHNNQNHSKDEIKCVPSDETSFNGLNENIAKKENNEQNIFSNNTSLQGENEENDNVTTQSVTKNNSSNVVDTIENSKSLSGAFSFKVPITSIESEGNLEISNSGIKPNDNQNINHSTNPTFDALNSSRNYMNEMCDTFIHHHISLIKLSVSELMTTFTKILNVVVEKSSQAKDSIHNKWKKKALDLENEIHWITRERYIEQEKSKIEIAKLKEEIKTLRSILKNQTTYLSNQQSTSYNQNDSGK